MLQDGNLIFVKGCENCVNPDNQKAPERTWY